MFYLYLNKIKIMIKYQFTIIAMFSVAEGGNKEIAKFEFYAVDKNTAEIIKESLMEAYFSSGNYRPNPRQATDLIEFLN